MSHTPEPKPRSWTVAEYLRLGELGILDGDERVELIEGEILSMPPQLAPHFAALNLAARACERCFGSGYWVRTQGPLEVGERAAPEPDVSVVKGSLQDYLHHHPDDAVLVIEVSDTSLDLDRTRKASLYARAGIRDYWILNLRDHLVEVRREPAPVPSAIFGSDYTTISLYQRGQSIEPIAAPGYFIAVDDLLP